MFTGIIQTVGHLLAQESKSGDKRMTIATGDMDVSDVSLGDSIAVNGVCLTAVTLNGQEFSADVSNETLSHTTLGDLKVGAPVNLEKAMQLTTRLGGHLVSGHVDGVAKVLAAHEDARSVRFEIEAPEALAKYIAAKGSVCVDGVSLTVNQVNASVFDVNIVPHTMSNTIISHYKQGAMVNIEVDVVARYLERLLVAGGDMNSDTITANSLRDAGFIN